MRSEPLMQWRFSPAQVLIAGAALGFAATLLGVWLVTHAPWIGVDFRPPDAGRELTIARVYPDGPAAGRLHPGDTLVAVLDASGSRIPVDAGLMTGDPYTLPSWAAMDEHMRLSGAVHRVLESGHVDLELRDGTMVGIHPDAKVPLHAVPAPAWLMLVSALLAYLICLGVWAYQPRNGAARTLALCGASVLLTFICVVSVNYRSWTLAEPVYRAVIDANIVAVSFAAYTFLAVFWYYPRPLHRFPFTTAALLLATLAPALSLTRSASYPGQVMLPVVVGYALFPIPLCIAQWRRTRHQPLERAALKWLYFVVAITCGAIAATNNLPIVLGVPPLVSSEVPQALGAAALFGGIALGILRYRLFNLDRWWFEGWMWALGGMLVIAFDALLLWFNASYGVALGIALALAGWVWFPLRQWLWRRLSPAARQTLEQHLPQLIDTLFAARTAKQLQHSWQELLRGIYTPLNLRVAAQNLDQPVISQDGLVLRVPGLYAPEYIDLQYGHKGQRLFSTADERLAASLLGLARQAVQARRAQDEHEAQRQAQQREKELLVQDLHDGLGGAVTNIGLLAEMGCKQMDVGAAHRALRAIGGLAQESASEIRSFMTTIEDIDADWQDVAADLRLCARGALEPHAIEKEFAAALDKSAPPPDAVLRMNLFRAFKEALSNVVKHARARHVRIELIVGADCLRLTVSDDGAGFRLDAAAPGAFGNSRGLRHLRERAQTLGGELSLRSAPGMGTNVTLTIPHPVKSPMPGIANGAPGL